MVILLLSAYIIMTRVITIWIMNEQIDTIVLEASIKLFSLYFVLIQQKNLSYSFSIRTL